MTDKQDKEKQCGHGKREREGPGARGTLPLHCEMQFSVSQREYQRQNGSSKGTDVK